MEALAPAKLGTRLKIVRIVKGVSQRELARELGLHPGTLSDYECGWRQPSPDQLKRIAAALGVSVREIVGDGGR